MRPPTPKLCPQCHRLLPRNQFPHQGTLCQQCRPDHRRTWAYSLYQQLLGRAKHNKVDFQEINSRMIAAIGYYQAYKCFLCGMPLKLGTVDHTGLSPALVRVQPSAGWKPGNVILILNAWEQVYAHYSDLASFRSCVHIASAPLMMAVPDVGVLLQLMITNK